MFECEGPWWRRYSEEEEEKGEEEEEEEKVLFKLSACVQAKEVEEEEEEEREKKLLKVEEDLLFSLLFSTLPYLPFSLAKGGEGRGGAPWGFLLLSWTKGNSSFFL